MAILANQQPTEITLNIDYLFYVKHTKDSFICTFDLSYVDGAEQQQTQVDKPWREHTDWTEEVGFIQCHIDIVNCFDICLTIS